MTSKSDPTGHRTNDAWGACGTIDFDTQIQSKHIGNPSKNEDPKDMEFDAKGIPK